MGFILFLSMKTNTDYKIGIIVMCIITICVIATIPNVSYLQRHGYICELWMCSVVFCIRSDSCADRRACPICQKKTLGWILFSGYTLFMFVCTIICFVFCILFEENISNLLIQIIIQGMFFALVVWLFLFNRVRSVFLTPGRLNCRMQSQ